MYKKSIECRKNEIVILKIEETKKLVKKVDDEDLINDAYLQIYEIEDVLNKYDEAINKLRYSLYQ